MILENCDGIRTADAVLHMKSCSTSLGLLLVTLTACALTACSESPSESEAGALSGEQAPEASPAPSAEGEAQTPSATPAPPPVDPNALPTITSGDGITVESVARVSARTFDIVLSTPHISNAATLEGNGVRITLPPDYATSGKRYPVVYDLHGAGGQSYKAHWWNGELEGMASGANADVIIVMPDGGKNGWYTDWVDGSIPQNWETYHLTQLVPFIDRNLRTIADRSARGIIGTSMGGFGASRYAVDRPDLFAALGTVSGATNSENIGIQTIVIAASTLFQLPMYGAYGPPGPLSAKWAEANPVRRAGRLANVATFMTVGNAGEDPLATTGIIGAAVIAQVNAAINQIPDPLGLRGVFNDIAATLRVPPPPTAQTDLAGAVLGPITEGTVREASVALHNALVQAKVKHEFEILVPRDTPYGHCVADHGWPCLKDEFASTLPKVLGVLADAR